MSDEMNERSAMIDEANAYFESANEPQDLEVEDTTVEPDADVDDLDEVGDVDLDADELDEPDDADDDDQPAAAVDLDSVDDSEVIQLEGQTYTKAEIGKGMHRLKEYHRKQSKLDLEHKTRMAEIEARESALPSDDDLKAIQELKFAGQSDAGRLALIESQVGKIADPKVRTWFENEVFSKLKQAQVYDPTAVKQSQVEAENQALRQQLEKRTLAENMAAANAAARPKVRENFESEGVQMPDDDWGTFFDWHEDRHGKGITLPVNESLELWQAKHRKAKKKAEAKTKTPTPGKRTRARKVDPHSFDSRLEIANQIAALGADA